MCRRPSRDEGRYERIILIKEVLKEPRIRRHGQRDKMRVDPGAVTIIVGCCAVKENSSGD